MRLYLSSFRMGNCPERLLELTRGGRRAALIANATDDYPPELRREGVLRELDELRVAGMEPEELDLRDHFDRQLTDADFDGIDLLWVRGGEVFLLRYLMRRSGLDRAVRFLLARDALVYGGYSAGPCVLAPNLDGLEIVDDVDVVDRLYGEPASRDGLGCSRSGSCRTSGRPSIRRARAVIRSHGCTTPRSGRTGRCETARCW
jgi:dipeptidase E